MSLYFTVMVLQNQQITPILQKQTSLIKNILLSSDRNESYKTNASDSLFIIYNLNNLSRRAADPSRDNSRVPLSTPPPF